MSIYILFHVVIPKDPYTIYVYLTYEVRHECNVIPNVQCTCMYVDVYFKAAVSQIYTEL